VNTILWCVCTRLFCSLLVRGVIGLFISVIRLFMDLVVTTSWKGAKGEGDWTCIGYKEKPTLR
jgi:hypothetical protein